MCCRSSMDSDALCCGETRPHRAEVVGVMQQISGSLRRQVLLSARLHKALDVALQVRRFVVVNHLTLHDTSSVSQAKEVACVHSHQPQVHMQKHASTAPRPKRAIAR